MGASLSKIKMDYVSHFSYKESEQFSSDDEIEIDLCIFSRVNIPIFMVSSDSDTD